jgi:trimeric autotransporter adhesin
MGVEQVGLCTAVGFQALANATGYCFANSGFGYKALVNNTDGFGNTGIGLQALLTNTTGSGNVAIGTL